MEMPSSVKKTVVKSTLELAVQGKEFSVYGYHPVGL